MKAPFLFTIDAASDISFSTPKMKRSLYLYAILQGYLIATAFNSYFDAVICILSIILLPSPLPYLIKRYLQLRKNNNLNILTISKLLQYKSKLSDDLYLGNGFEWLPRHTRLLHEQLQSGLKSYSSKRHGSFALQNMDFKNEKRLYIPVSDLTLHTIIFGTTGSGKTRLFDLLTVQAVLRGDTVIVIDPKSDSDLLYRITACARKNRRERSLHVINLANIKESSKINPLGTYNRPSEIASRITSLMPDSGSAQSFKAHAHSAITAAVAALTLENKKVNLKNLLQSVSHQERFGVILDNYIKELVLSLNNPKAEQFYLTLYAKAEKDALASTKNFNKENAKDPLNRKGINNIIFHLELVYNYLCENNIVKTDGDILTLFSVAQMDPSYYQKLTASVMPCLRTLCGGDLNAMLSPHSDNSKEITLDYLISGNGIIYVSLNCLSDPTLGGYLGKLLIADLCAVAGKIYTNSTYHNSAQRHKVSVFIDEAGEMAGEPLVQLLNKSRGADFAVTIATQTFSDLAKRSGSEDAALQIIGNCNNKISLRLKDATTAEIFTKAMPHTSVPSQSSSISYTENDSSSGVNYGASRSISMEKSPLFPPEALQYLPDLEFVGLFADGKIFKGRLPLISPN